MIEFSIEDIKRRIDIQMEQLEDIIEFLEASIINREPMWSEGLKALKDAYEAHDSENWEDCQSALAIFFEYVYDSILLIDLSKWNHRHILRWQKMLDATKFGIESEDELYHIFYHSLKQQILDRIPPKFRLAYKDYLKDLSPGFIEMLQNFSNDHKDSELHNEIIDFTEKEIGREAEKQTI